MITRKEYDMALKTVRLYQDQIRGEYIELKNEKIFDHNKYTLCINTDMSVTLYNKLNVYFSVYGTNVRDKTVSDLSKVSISYFSRVSGVGKVLVKELVDVCVHAGVVMKP